ncbi:MAG: hypothetical protein ACREF5_03130 [Candidatus Saccharimonadales bacterium]
MDQANEEQRPILTPSWSLVRKNYDLLTEHLEQVVIIVLLPTLTITLGDLLIQSQKSLGTLVFLIGVLWYFFNIAASYGLQLSAAKGKHIKIGDLYSQNWRYEWRLTCYTLIFAAITLIGFILLVIPGLIILRRYLLSGFYVIDKNLSIGEAMKLSAAQTKAVSGYIWGTIGVVVALGIAGVVVSFLFTAIPGVPSIISSLVILSYIFVLAQRYLEVEKNAVAT